MSTDARRPGGAFISPLPAPLFMRGTPMSIAAPTPPALGAAGVDPAWAFAAAAGGAGGGEAGAAVLLPGDPGGQSTPTAAFAVAMAAGGGGVAQQQLAGGGGGAAAAGAGPSSLTSMAQTPMSVAMSGATPMSMTETPWLPAARRGGAPQAGAAGDVLEQDRFDGDGMDMSSTPLVVGPGAGPVGVAPFPGGQEGVEAGLRGEAEAGGAGREALLAVAQQLRVDERTAARLLAAAGGDAVAAIRHNLHVLVGRDRSGGGAVADAEQLLLDEGLL